MLRNVADCFSHQHQLQITGVAFLELDKIPEQGRAVFSLINSTDINQIRVMNPVFLPECRGWRIIRNIYACSQHITRDSSGFELPPHEHPFLFRQENIRLRQLKQLFKCLKMQVWFFVSSRNENRFLCHFRQSGNRQIIQIGDKQKGIVFIFMLPNKGNAFGAIWPLLFKPDFFYTSTVISLFTFCQISSIIGIKIHCPFLCHGKPAYCYPVDGFHIPYIPVFPCGIVHGFGGQYVHFIVLRQPFRHQAGIIFRTPVDL